MSCTGGDAGGVGGGRKLGNHPLPPLGRMAGTKRERPSQRLQGGGEGGTQRATWWDPGREPSPRPPPRHTHLPVPAPSLTGATLFHAAQNTENRRIGSSPTPGPLSPGIPAENQLRDGGAGRVDGSPSPLPTHSQSPPTASRRFPGHRSARFWRPESRRGDPGAPRGCRGSKGTPRTAGGRDRGFRAHLAGQLSAPVDPRPCEGFDPRHNPMEGRPGGCGADPGVRLLWGEGGGGVCPARVSLGDRKSDSPRPAPSSSSSNPSLHPRPSSGRGEAGRREGGVPRAGRDASVSGGAARKSTRGRGLAVQRRCMPGCVCVLGGGGRSGVSNPCRLGCSFPKTLPGPIRSPHPTFIFPFPFSSPKAVHQSRKTLGPEDSSCYQLSREPGPVPSWPLGAHQSRPEPTDPPFTIGAGVGRGRRNQRGTKSWVLVLYRAWRKNPRGEGPSPSPQPLWGLPGRHSAHPLPSCFCLHRRLGPGVVGLRR